MEIAPGFTDAHWRALDLSVEADRQRAVDAFWSRLERRFLEPARTLLELRWSGFAILALDCLLLETLEQFEQGVCETPSRQAESYFRSALQRPAFGGAFDNEMADLFRKTVRNGILHQAEVKRSSLVRRDGPLVQLTDDRDGVIVNPERFHASLEQALQDYVADLRQPGSLRWQAFRRKMECIAGRNPSL